MREHLTAPEYQQPKLAERIAVTHEGQVTWADPSLAKRCAACRHYASANISRGKQKDFGRCGMVKVMTRKPGKPFDGQRAWACSKFEARS